VDTELHGLPIVELKSTLEDQDYSALHGMFENLYAAVHEEGRVL
tara:strand:+ start:667 stop:798 length:132 start_codon:yes stop_codon:yes gene_type:complete